MNFTVCTALLHLKSFGMFSFLFILKNVLFNFHILWIFQFSSAVDFLFHSIVVRKNAWYVSNLNLFCDLPWLTLGKGLYELEMNVCFAAVGKSDWCMSIRSVRSIVLFRSSDYLLIWVFYPLLVFFWKEQLESHMEDGVALQRRWLG